MLSNSYLLDKPVYQQPETGGTDGAGGLGLATLGDKALGSYKVINFSVFDNGVGVKKEDQNRLFEAYTQIRPGELQGGRGTGVGLAICKQIIAKHDGLIGLRSVPPRRSSRPPEMT